MPDEATHVIVNEHVAIPRHELTYRATRAGGPGGQHVNTSSTKVELTWDVTSTTALNDEQRSRVRAKLSKRMDASGTLRLTASASRSQHQNREAVTERLTKLVGDALRPRKARRKTRPTRASREARLKAKRKRAEIKRDRRSPADE